MASFSWRKIISSFYTDQLSSGDKTRVLLVLIAYYLSVVLPHKRFGAFLNDVVFKGVARDQYNLIVLIGAILVFTGLLIIFFKNTAYSKERNKLRIYLLFNTLFAIVVVKTLFVINIELIHFPQYALFAILVFPLARCYNSALLWSFQAGAIDEAYQYFYLAPNDTAYYDFNDLVTNLVGAAFGLIFLISFGIQEKQNCSVIKSVAFKSLVLIGGVILILLLVGFLSIYPSQESTYQLVREQALSFWSTVPLGFTYHIITPPEGIFVLSLLFVFYSRIGK